MEPSNQDVLFSLYEEYFSKVERMTDDDAFLTYQGEIIEGCIEQLLQKPDFDGQIESRIEYLSRCLKSGQWLSRTG